MKKTICIICSFVILISAILPCSYIINSKSAEQEIIDFSENCIDMIKSYDADEDYMLNADSTQSLVRNRLIVMSDNLKNEYNCVDRFSGLGYTVMQYDDVQLAQVDKTSLEEKGYIVEYDSIYRTDSVTSTPDDSSTWANERVESAEALSYITSSGKDLAEVTIGVIDSGVDYNHELLSDRIDDTSNNFSSSGNENDCLDEFGHGTMVSGVIAQNTTDNIKIKPFKVMNNEGSTTLSQMIPCFESIINDNNAPEILNMSFGFNSLSAPVILGSFMTQLIDKGIIIVASAGNDNANSNKKYPANIPEVITVSASEENNKKCSFSNYGSCIDLAAPGYKVYTSNIGGGYSSPNGTSFSAPLVCSAAATVLMQDKSLSATQVESIIKNSCVPVYDKFNDLEWCGSGILNFSGLCGESNLSVPVFSYDEGEYFSDFELTITAPENSTIVYTTDYSIPSIDNGTVYTEPITISETQHIIATTINSNQKSACTGATYHMIYTPDESDFTINSSGNITGYTGDKDSIVVPDRVNNKVVKGVAASAFKDNSTLKYIKFPDSATTIKQNAFNGSSINTIIAKGITKIESYAFKGCHNLFKINMPNVVTGGREIFNGCKSLDTVDFNETIEEVDELAFAGTNIQDAYFPLITVTSSLFKNDTNLMYADLPSAEWLSGTFYGCIKLRDMNIPNVTEISNSAFYNCSALYQFDFSNIELVSESGFRNSFFDVIELENCTEIEEGAFLGANAYHISLPKVQTIYDNCFANCGSLRSVFMPEVTEFYNLRYGEYFHNCINLRNLYLPKAEGCPSVKFDEVTLNSMEEKGLTPLLEYVYAPNATQVQSSTGSSAFLEHCAKVEFAYLPSVTSIEKMPDIPNMIWYLSDEVTSLPQRSNSLISTQGFDYKVVAPSASYAEQWANDNGHTFLDTESCLCTGVSGNDFVYTCSANNETCIMPIDLVEQMWYDYLPINKTPDFMTHGYLIDVVSDKCINAKDFGKILNSNDS